jgi:hypothetical protein
MGDGTTAHKGRPWSRFLRKRCCGIYAVAKPLFGLAKRHYRRNLGRIDLFNPNEPARYIITVEALKEGWDCSFAYILCSLAHVESDTSVEQLLGRVMRMPYAKTRKSPLLNKAYAYVVSPHFEEAAVALTEKLINKGFDSGEAQAAIQQEQSALPGPNPNWNTPYNQFTVHGNIKAADIPPSIKFDHKGTLFFTPGTSRFCPTLPIQTDVWTPANLISSLTANYSRAAYRRLKCWNGCAGISNTLRRPGKSPLPI